MMDELLKKLLEAEILSAETKKELEDAFKTQIEEATNAAKEEAAKDVRAELTEQWIKERDVLIDAIDSKVEEYLKNEIHELREDIESFRDLEAEYAQKLVEAKAAMGSELKGDLTELVEKLDAFLEMRLSAEMEELREDIDRVRENEFGRRIFEAMVQEYRDYYADPVSDEANAAELKARLADTEKSLEEAEQKAAALERKQKMEDVLKPLSGRAKEVMEAILRNVTTDKLEEGYKTFIGRVVRETKEETSEKEETVLAANSSSNKTAPITEKDGVVVTGDTEEVLTEGDTSKAKEANRYEELRKLAGMR